jgi:CDP-diacylglycerol---glycerol-3-phosphate 3-phosphatidyltransferase
LRNILKYFSKNEKGIIKIASGYMNFPGEINDIIGQFKIPMELTTASPMANGFFNDGAIKSLIPKVYKSMENNLIQSYRANVREYNREGWTFHAKGLWGECADEYLMGIGSSNYSNRSFTRDTELQFYFYSSCPKFKNAIDNEYDSIRKYTTKAVYDNQSFKIKALSKLVKSVL